MAALTFDRYPFLKDLHLAPENLGCFDGEWFASGDFITSTRLIPILRSDLLRLRHQPHHR